MIGLDTNVLVRYIAQDDAKQSPIATKLITSLTTENPGFISQVSLVELVLGYAKFATKQANLK